MPCFAFKRLGITNIEPTNITLHLIVCLVFYPRGAIKDVLVKVDKFIFPSDFVTIDMEADKDVPIILGQTFLSTCDLLVEVSLGRLTFRLADERIMFNLPDTLKQPSSFASCSYTEFVDMSDALMEGVFSSVGIPNPLERVFTDEDLDWDLNPEVQEILMFLHSQHNPRPSSFERLE